MSSNATIIKPYTGCKKFHRHIVCPFVAALNEVFAPELTHSKVCEFLTKFSGFCLSNDEIYGRLIKDLKRKRKNRDVGWKMDYKKLDCMMTHEQIHHAHKGRFLRWMIKCYEARKIKRNEDDICLICMDFVSNTVVVCLYCSKCVACIRCMKLYLNSVKDEEHRCLNCQLPYYNVNPLYVLSKKRKNSLIVIK